MRTMHKLRLSDIILKYNLDVLFAYLCAFGIYVLVVFGDRLWRG